MSKPTDTTFLGYIRHKFNSSRSSHHWNLRHLSEHFIFGIVILSMSLIYFIMASSSYDIPIFVLLAANAAIILLIIGCSTIYVGKFNDIHVMIISMFIIWFVSILLLMIEFVTLFYYFFNLSNNQISNFKKYTFIVIPILNFISLVILLFYMIHYQIDEVYNAEYVNKKPIKILMKRKTFEDVKVIPEEDPIISLSSKESVNSNISKQSSSKIKKKKKVKKSSSVSTEVSELSNNCPSYDDDKVMLQEPKQNDEKTEKSDIQLFSKITQNTKESGYSTSNELPEENVLSNENTKESEHNNVTNNPELEHFSQQNTIETDISNKKP